MLKRVKKYDPIAWFDTGVLATCSLRWYFPEEERMMQYSRDKYFPQLRTKVFNPVGEPTKIPLSAPAHTRANTCTQRK